MGGYREGLNKKEKLKRLFTWIMVALIIAIYTRVIIMILFGFLVETGILMEAWEMLLWISLFVGYVFSRFYVMTKVKEFHDEAVSSYQFTDTYVRKTNKGEDILYGIDPTSIVEVKIDWTTPKGEIDSNQVFLDIRNSYMKSMNVDRVSREQILLITSGSDESTSKKDAKKEREELEGKRKKRIKTYLDQKERIDKLFLTGVITSNEDYNKRIEQIQNNCGVKCQKHFLFSGESDLVKTDANESIDVLDDIPQMFDTELTSGEILILQNCSFYFARLYESETFEGVKIKHDMVALVLPPEIVLEKRDSNVVLNLKKGTFQDYYEFPVDNAEHQGYPVKIKMCRDARDLIGFIGPSMPLYFVRWTQKMGLGLLETAMSVAMMVNVKIELLTRYVYYMKSVTQQAEMQIEESEAILEYIQDKFDDNIQRIEELGEAPFGEDPFDERISKIDVVKREKFYKTVIGVLIALIVVLSAFTFLSFLTNAPSPDVTNGEEFLDVAIQLTRLKYRV